MNAVSLHGVERVADLPTMRVGFMRESTRHSWLTPSARSATRRTSLEVISVSEGSDDYGIPIYEFEKSSSKRIRFHVQEYKGTEFLDIREFYMHRESGEWRPSPKGITVQPHLYAELLNGVVQSAEALGLEPPEGFTDSE